MQYWGIDDPKAGNKDKIIRIGDYVKVINPTIFIRCGYPLGLNDMRKEVVDQYGEEIEKLIKNIMGERKDDKLIKSLGEFKVPPTIRESRIFYDIVNSFAYPKLVAKNYGGKERTLHTELCPQIKDTKARVNGIRMVVTGIYNQGHSGYTYEGDWDGYPSYLSDTKSHKILKLDLYRDDINLTYLHRKGDEQISIEACNVVKIIEKNYA